MQVKEGMEEFSEESRITPDQASYLIQEGNALVDEGVNLILSNQKELIINHDIIESLFSVLCKYAVTRPKEHEEIPEIEADASPEKVDAMNGVI